MIGFKATKNGKCFNITFEPNKIYIFNGNIKLCRRGFHFCKKIEDVHEYYPLNEKNTIIFLIEIPNDAQIIQSKQDSKCVTDKIKIIKKLTKKEIEKYSNGNIKFDDKGNLIYCKNYFGLEKRKYDKHGYEVYYENITGYWVKRQYDKNGNLIYYENSNGYWERYKYDKYGNKICYEDFNGYWCKRMYDKNGNEIYYENSYNEKYTISIKEGKDV